MPARGRRIYVRSVRGPKGGWYRRLRANPDGEVRDGEHHHQVRAKAVTDAGTLGQVTRAYATKYGSSPSRPATPAGGRPRRCWPRGRPAPPPPRPSPGHRRWPADLAPEATTVSRVANPFDLACSRGSALPRQLERFGAVRASLALGVIWAVWHLPLFWTDGSWLSGSSPWILLLELPAVSVLFTWVFLHTRGSALLAILFHASMNLCAMSACVAGRGHWGPVLVVLGLKWLLAGIVVTSWLRWPGATNSAAIRRTDPLVTAPAEPTIKEMKMTPTFA